MGPMIKLEWSYHALMIVGTFKREGHPQESVVFFPKAGHLWSNDDRPGLPDCTNLILDIVEALLYIGKIDLHCLTHAFSQKKSCMVLST